MKRMAIWAKVSKHARQFCISLVTGMSNVAKSVRPGLDEVDGVDVAVF